MINKYSSELLSLPEHSLSMTDVGKILWEGDRDTTDDFHPETKHFNEGFNDGLYWHNCPYYMPTYICFLAAMNDQDMQEYKESFEGPIWKLRKENCIHD